jgi:plastocyanin
VSAGESLTWVNLDPVAHDVVAGDGHFESPLVPPGGSWALAFTQAGSFPYVCTLHRGMEGVVTVTSGNAG